MGMVTPLKAIRKNCIECSGGSVKEVAMCVIPDCALYPFRFGKNPYSKRVGNPDALKRYKALGSGATAKNTKLQHGVMSKEASLIGKSAGPEKGNAKH
jgi:hypothetical protein